MRINEWLKSERMNDEKGSLKEQTKRTNKQMSERAIERESKT